MSDTRCISCGTVGFVRHEHVITGATSIIEYTCGRCHHVWREDEKRKLNDRRRPSRGNDRRKSR